MDADEEIKQNRARYLAAALPFVEQAGWSGLDMALIAKKAGLKIAEARLLFPARGASRGASVADFFLLSGDEQMQRDVERDVDRGAMPSSMRERIGWLIWQRLAVDKDRKAIMRRTSAFFMLPPYWPRGAACLARTSDMIWRLAGDESADFSYYTKRTLLAGIFSESLMIFLSRRGEDEDHVRAFIARRIDHLMTAARLLRGEFSAKKPPRREEKAG